MKEYLSKKVNKALSKMGVSGIELIFERPKEEKYGDLSTNAAMLLAKQLKENPRDAAQQIIANLELPDPFIKDVNIAGAGFINFYISNNYYLQQLKNILQKGNDYGKSSLHKNQTANIEWVSANPTGPLHAGHGRHIALGKAVANLLEWSGYKVTREYYYNDAGKQMDNLAKSVYARYLQENYKKDFPFPNEGYVGDYIKDILNEVKKYYLLKFIQNHIKEINDEIQSKTGYDLLNIPWSPNKNIVQEVLQELVNSKFDKSFQQYLDAIDITHIDKSSDLKSIVDFISKNLKSKISEKLVDEKSLVKDIIIKLINENVIHSNAYINKIAKYLHDRYGDQFEGVDLMFFKDFAENECWNNINHTLYRMNVKHDRHFSERSLYESGKIDILLEKFKVIGFSYEKDGAVWLKLSELKDEKGKQLFENDKVIVKSSGEPTYRLPDMAYHIDKLTRPDNYSLIVDIFGSDHSETYKEVLAGVGALGYDTSKIKVIIHQMVTFVQEGKPVKMSKRSDNVYYLDDLLDDLGKGKEDVAQFFFVMRSANTHLDFDVKLAKEQSDKNPVFYLQYAHARICGILRNAEGVLSGYSKIKAGDIDFSLMKENEEMDVIKTLTYFPEIVESSALTYEPHKIITYLNELAEHFHKFYHNHRVLNVEAKDLSYARLKLCEAVKTVLKNGFSIIGINAPERM